MDFAFKRRERAARSTRQDTVRIHVVKSLCSTPASANRRISRARRRYAIYDGRIAISEARAAYAQHKEIFDEPPQPRSSSDLRACHRIGELLGGGTATQTFSACDQSANETT